MQNRKLRHLQGISIRNLCLAPAHTRPRRQTIDDEAIPSTLESPAKSLAVRDARVLAHSRSSSDLKGKSKGKDRRRTIESQTASPWARQKKLEDAAAIRMADTFFTLHVDGQDEPVYISEVVDKAVNPSFRFFDLAPCGPSVTRSDRLTVKVWAKSGSSRSWQYLIAFSTHLPSLQFIGKTVGKFRHPLPQNCILLHMTDGIYTSFIDMPVAEELRATQLAPPKEHPEGRTLASSSYDALMRLNTLDDCIQDALATRDRLADEIESILRETRETSVAVEEVPEAEERRKAAEAAVIAERRRVDAARRKRDELKANNHRRRELMRKGHEAEAEKEKDMAEAKTGHRATKELLTRTQEELVGQRRRICEDLQRIFPIEPVPGKALLFTIRKLALPNSEFEDAQEDVVAAALGYVAETVSLLAPYFSVLLPYPMKVNGSTSTIDDVLAMNTAAQSNTRTYPLFMKGVVRYRFEYGVFLLNKNIEILCNSLGLRPVDVRHTLPNLKYLLFVATAGKGELPARKAGGIRGLLLQEGVVSRKGSMDSASSRNSALPSRLRVVE